MENLITKYLEEKVNSRIFSGCSLIFGKPFQKQLECHVGETAFGSGKKINSKTSFDLQSITKAILLGPLFAKLSLENKINLKDPVSSLSPELGKMNPIFNDISLVDLLTHSSGLSDADLDVTYESPGELWYKMINSKLHFDPGSSIEYSDLGYRIAGKALETKFGKNLELLAYDYLWKNAKVSGISYHPVDSLNIAATPDANGFIDDEQVKYLGSVLGCDGLFGNAEGIFHLLSSFLSSKETRFLDEIEENKSISQICPNSFFDSLAYGSKNLGWEININSLSYAGKFHGHKCFEKAGGAGTFVWFDRKSQYIFIFLTNFGKPKPFTELSWNILLDKVSPHKLSNLIYENI